LWQEDTATIKTFYGKSIISTKPILVAPSGCHNRQTFCGERLLQQYKHFLANRLFQQNRYSWCQGVITIDKIFVVRGYCDNINILRQKDISTKMKLVAPSSYLNGQTIRS
jgi:hypothetical protein